MSLTTTQREILQIVAPGNTVLVLDVETTGFRNSDKVIQFAGSKFLIKEDYSLEETDGINIYINPEMKLPEEIVQFNEINKTGINDDFLKDKPVEADVYNDIIAFFNCNICTGYNVGFDFRMLYNMANRLGKSFDITPTFDIMNLAKDFLKKPEDVPNHKLSTVVEKLGINVDGFHTANNDVAATAKVLEVIIKKYLEYIPPTAKNAKLMKARLSYNYLTKRSRKIVLKLSIGKEGDMYYDVDNGKWEIKSSAPVDIFLPEVISQFRKMYIAPFGYTNEQEVAEKWFEMAEKEKPKAKKKK